MFNQNAFHLYHLFFKGDPITTLIAMPIAIPTPELLMATLFESSLRASFQRYNAARHDHGVTNAGKYFYDCYSNYLSSLWRNLYS